MTNKEELIKQLNSAKQKIEEASSELQEVARSVKDMDVGYNMSGNMHAYVINYLTDGIDCVTDKIDKYIEDIEDIIEDDESDEEE